MSQLNKLYTIYLVTFILAFSSIVYELLLGQSLSAFLGNTVLRFSITIGLYLFAMGIGAFIAEKKFTVHYITTLLVIEIILVILGGGSVIFLHLINALQFPVFLFSFIAHLLIFIIGILTGFEIPLLMSINNKHNANSENKVLGINYIGAFCGSIMFAFIFFPSLGLVQTAFITALLNSAAGVLFLTQKSAIAPHSKPLFNYLISFLFVLGIVLVLGLYLHETIHEALINLYLSG